MTGRLSPWRWIVSWSSIIYRYNWYPTTPISLTALSCGRRARTWEMGIEPWEWWPMSTSTWMLFMVISILEESMMVPSLYSGNGTAEIISTGRSQVLTVSFKHHNKMVKELRIWSLNKLHWTAFILVFFQGWAYKPSPKFIFLCLVSWMDELQDERGYIAEVGVLCFISRYHV